MKTELAEKGLADAESGRLERGLSYSKFGWLHLPCSGVADIELKKGIVKYCPKHKVSSDVNPNPEGKIIAY